MNPDAARSVKACYQCQTVGSINGDLAFDWGWHKVRSTDRQTGEINDTKYRYSETWTKVDGSWKINYIISNKEQPPKMLPEEESTATPGRR